MGRKNPDRIRYPPSALQAPTLDGIARSGWTVIARCNRCRLALHVDTAAMLKVLGPDFVLWGRKPRCRAWLDHGDHRCAGRVTFHAQAIAGGSWKELAWSGEVDLALDFRRQIRAEREAFLAARTNPPAAEPLPSDDDAS